MGSGMEHPGRLREVPPLPPNDSEDLEESKLVLEAVRDVLEEQRASAERLRSSARQTFVFVAGLFTVAQTAVLTDFGGTAALGEEDLTKLLVIGVAAVVGVGVTGLLALYADILQSAPAIAISDIVREVDEAAERDEPASDALTRLYASATKQQQPVIESRRTRVRLVSISAAITVAIVVTEIAVALIARIP